MFYLNRKQVEGMFEFFVRVDEKCLRETRAWRATRVYPRIGPRTRRQREQVLLQTLCAVTRAGTRKH